MSERAAIVTGGASGIGLATVRQLHTEGWRVLAADRDSKALDAAREEFAAAGDRVRLVELDVTHEPPVERVVSEAASFGALKGIVNSAGIGRDLPFLETSADLFRQIYEINVVGTVLVSQAGVRAMRGTGGGAIVNIGSVSGMRGNIGRAAYGASKGAVLNLTQVMAVELAL